MHNKLVIAGMPLSEEAQEALLQKINQAGLSNCKIIEFVEEEGPDLHELSIKLENEEKIIQNLRIDLLKELKSPNQPFYDQVYNKNKRKRKY